MDTQKSQTTQHPDIQLLTANFQGFAELWRKNFFCVADAIGLSTLTDDVALYNKFTEACRLISETIGEMAARDIRSRCRIENLCKAD